MCRLSLPAVAAGLAVLFAGPAARAQTTVTGQVVVKNPPVPGVVNVGAGNQACLVNGPVVYEDVIVDGKNGGLKNVVVYLRPDSDDRKATFPVGFSPAAPPVERVIDQPCCQFEPRILAARSGDTLKIKNSAPVNHNFQSADLNMNPNIPPGGAVMAPAPLQAQTAAMPFACNIHPWMKGAIRVFDHPWFTVTDKDGNFAIKNVPAGDYRIVYWHENGYHMGRKGVTGDKLTVKAGGPQAVPALQFQFP